MKTILTPFTRRSDTVRKILRIAGASLLLLSFGQRAQAQFPRRESFSSNTATGFTLGGTPKEATLTSTTGTNGYLRLTTDEQFQSGFAVDKTSFPAPQGFSISFEFFSYGMLDPGADGFSVFLVDAAGTDPTLGQFRIGADGGSLGYAQRNVTTNNVTTVTPGVSKGYIGIGIDEYGNFSNPLEGNGTVVEGREGGPGFRPQSVSIRGAGNGTTGYTYLTGTNTLPFTLDVAADRAQRFNADGVTVNPDYRRAYIDVQPVATAGVTTYLITVRIQHGAVVTTVINRFPVATPPANLRLGFAASTGGSRNTHEIRNLEIVQAPFALDDLAGTPYNKPVSLNILTNDVPSGSDIVPATVDLDPNTAGRQTNFSVPNQGTFLVDDAGNVTFTPSGTFVGVVTIPYTVADNIQDDPNVRNTSNPANISVIVTGADIATSVSGPATANPSSRVTYTVSTTNLGTETATNVVPTLRLPSGASSISRPANSTIATVGGVQVITFAPEASLAPNDPAIVNSVTFTMPATGNITGTAGSTSSVPDPTPGNNTAIVTTTVSGVANVAAVCATPGKDGVGTLTSSSIPNTYYQIANNTTVVATATSMTLGAAAITADATPISVGDLVLIMQMQGVDINTANTTSYGTAGAYNTVGQYEYAIAANSVPLTGGSLNLVKGLTNSYENKEYDGTNTGRRSFQVIRVPQYSSVTITGTVTGKAWDGSTGGVLALDVAGRTTFNPDGALNMNAKGFRGGGGKSYTNSLGAVAQLAADYRTATALSINGSKGEGTAGTPRYVYSGTGTTVTDYGLTMEGYGTGSDAGSNAAGAPGNAGGGALDYYQDNSGNAGGAGGANGGNGGRGGNGFGSGGNGTEAVGGRNVANIASGTRLMMGGGGGAGSTDDGAATEYLSSGAAGGGIIILRTATVLGPGLVQANGGSAETVNGLTRGGGGGGAGGTVLVLATPPTGAANLSSLTINAVGGVGASAGRNNNDRFGPGGGGGGGIIRTNADYANESSNATTIGGGARGGTGNNNSTAFGALAGNQGVSLINTTTTATIAGVSSCFPTLAATLSTSTPNVTRSSNGVNPATYELVISNTGGAATGVSIETTLTSNLFTYDNTVAPNVTLTLADGSSSPYTGYTAPTNSTSTATFSDLAIPAGATLRISFRATIASTAVNNTAYQASATVRFLDPTRLTATSTVSPTDAFAGGGTVSGSNYIATTSTAEDVTIVRPLPVELKQFSATAVRQDAQLSWSTASELNNDRFVVERSLDGLTFSAIGTVRGKGTSTQQSKYSFTDAGAARFGALIYYRLKQLDFDGTATFSPVRTVKFVDAIKVDVSVYPNPSQGNATLDLTGLPAGNYQVQVLDLTGRSLQILTLAGQQEHPLQVQALPHGSYIVRVRGAAVNVALPLVRN